MVSTLRFIFLASRRVTSAGQPPAAASRRARATISSRSASDSWLKCEPRRTRSVFSPTNRSTELRKKADPLAAVEHEPPADQPLLPPARNRLGRDVELLGQLLDRQHLLAGRFGRHVGRVRQVLDEQPQIVAGLFAGQLQVGKRIGR